jgi:hypothetical protein
MKRSSVFFLPPLLAAALAAAGAAHGQAYKCTDAKGKTVYSGHPCKGQGMTEQGTVKAPPPRPVDPPPHATANKPAPASKAQQPPGGAPAGAADNVPRDARGNPQT